MLSLPNSSTDHAGDRKCSPQPGFAQTVIRQDAGRPEPSSPVPRLPLFIIGPNGLLDKSLWAFARSCRPPPPCPLGECSGPSRLQRGLEAVRKALRTPDGMAKPRLAGTPPCPFPQETCRRSPRRTWACHPAVTGHSLHRRSQTPDGVPTRTEPSSRIEPTTRTKKRRVRRGGGSPLDRGHRTQQHLRGGRQRPGRP